MVAILAYDMRFFEHLPRMELMLLVGLYAQRWHLRDAAKPSLTETVASWREIAMRDVNGHHYILFRDYFCTTPSRRVTMPLKQIIATLKSGPKHPGE